MYPKIYLKPGKEKAVTARHHWVFSGALMKRDPGVQNGGVVAVFSADHKFLAIGYYNEKTSIAVRILSFEPAPIDGEFFWNRLQQANNARLELFRDSQTDCYRLLFSEGDFLPGLIIDRYGPGIVFQLQTLGLEQFRETFLRIIQTTWKPSFIYEKSEGMARLEEGLEARSELHAGELPEEGICVRENGVAFRVDIRQGQKTGFFLDQRDNRQLVRRLSRGKEVLNCFSYTGGFSVGAALGGAIGTINVDSSQPALDLARENFRLNGLPPGAHRFIQADVFEYLRASRDEFDLVILDPPAFAKRQSSITAAYRGYKDINLHAMKLVKPGGYLLTCSCSYYIDSSAFQKILFLAALDSGRQLQLIAKLPQPPDHPINLFHPESEYLKAFLCRVY